MQVDGGDGKLLPQGQLYKFPRENGELCPDTGHCAVMPRELDH